MQRFVAGKINGEMRRLSREKNPFAGNFVDHKSYVNSPGLELQSAVRNTGNRFQLTCSPLPGHHSAGDVSV
jgi:hypothetical protein